MTIYLIRHGETDNNGRRFAGRRDTPLNGIGRQQARRLADALGKEAIGEIWSSPLTRAVETATPLARRLGMPITLHSGLAEIDFGRLEGQLKDTVALKLRRDHRVEPVPDGESLLQVWNRLQDVAPRVLASETDGRNVAVVGHYWSNRMLFGIIRGWDFGRTCSFRDFRPKTGAWVVLVHPEVLSLVEGSVFSRDDIE